MGRLLLCGWLVGALLGALAGVAEAALAPLHLTARIPYALGADGLLGGIWGLGAALLAGARRLRAGPLRRAAIGPLVALVLFPFLAAAGGLAVNRTLLSGTHFLAPASLAADAIVLVLAGALAAGAGRVARRATRPPPPPRAAEGGGLSLPAAALASLLLLAGAFFLPARPRAHAGPGRGLPPVIVVSIDTLRPDRLSGGGEPEPTSPHLDRLCREGLFFSEAITVSPGSAASHAALLTSRYPVSNGVWANFSVMDSSLVTLAETLRARGYRTGGFVTNTFLGRRFGFDQGFDAYVESGVVERLEEPSRAALARSLALVQIVDRLAGRLRPGYEASFETALAWLGESRRPTFLFVHLMDVHSPYAPPRPFAARFGARPEGAVGSEAGRNRFGWRPSEEAYLAEIRFADTKIGRLRRRLEELGLLERAVIVLTSDHGENLLDHEPHFSHGRTLFEATLRILAAIRAPGLLRAGLLEPRVFENVDVLPTLGVLLGWESAPFWEGRAWTRGAPGQRSPTFAQLGRDFAVRTGRWKLLLQEDGSRVLYRLGRDPGEREPLLPSPGETRRAEEALEGWLEAHETPLYGERARTIAPEELSPEEIAKLRGLGYVD